ncbi:hypothetical protein SDC9_119015 [bioreactor metagenome]|uniref:Uncharacterized protein n=1 Tax=bioreactor metagenome TaxID=1076179 RepID=A0A645C309_9ZZZZ
MAEKLSFFKYLHSVSCSPFNISQIIEILYYKDSYLTNLIILNNIWIIRDYKYYIADEIAKVEISFG